MVKFLSEDIVIFSGLTPEITDMAIFYSALDSFFRKTQSIDSSNRFNYILFQEDKPNYLEEFTTDYDQIITSLRSLESMNALTNLANGIFGALPLFIKVFKKIGDKAFRLMVFIDSCSFKLPSYHIPVLNDLIEKIKQEMPFFMDVIGINVEDQIEEEKIKNIANKSGGDFYKIEDLQVLSDKLVLLAEKKEIKPLEALDKSDIERLKEKHLFYENFAQETLELKILETCSICFQKDDKDLVQCRTCETIAHKECWANWAKKSNIGIPNVFRCHSCYNLIKLERNFVYEVQFGESPFFKEVVKEATISDEEEMAPVSSVKIGSEEVKGSVLKYLLEKSRTNKKITKTYTIRGVKKLLNIGESDTNLDEDIWSLAINLTKDICVKTTPKTIVFRM
jgi:hypothetical protein